MKPIKRSYTTPLRKKIRKSFIQKSADSLVNRRTNKSSTEKFSSRSFSKKHKKKKAPLENTCHVASEQEMAEINNTDGCSPVTALTAFHLTNMRFIVLDGLDVRKDDHRKINRAVCDIKSNSKKISNRRKCHVIKRQTISTPLTLNKISKTKKRKNVNDGILTTSREMAISGKKTKNAVQSQQAAGDGEKKEKNFFKNKNEDNYSEWTQRTADTDDAYENISNTFLDICLPFTFARQKPVEDDVSKIDGKFIRSLMKIARSREVVKTRKIKIPKSKSRHNKFEGDDENVFFQDLPQRSNSERKSKKSKENGKKRLHQAQNIFFVSHKEREHKTDNSFCEQKTAKDGNQTFIIRKIKLQHLTFKNPKSDEIQLEQTKSEKFKMKTGTKEDDRHHKSRGVNLRRQETNAKELSLDEDDLNITELWRNETRVASDNSLSIRSSSSTIQKRNDYPADYEMKSYKALVKIVGEEVQRIYKHRQESSKKTESKELSMANVKETVKPAEKLEKPSKTSIVENENKTESENSSSKLDNPQQKLTIFAPEKLNKSFNEEKIEKPLGVDVELQNKRDKLNELKTKLNFLSEETHDSRKIQSEIVKNWSVIRRLEKAFLALGTPGFPNKNCKSPPGGTILQGTPKDSDLRKCYSPDKMARTKTKTAYNYEELQAKSQIPVLYSGKYDAAATNKRGCEQFPKVERREGGKKLVRSEDFDKSDIYFFSFEPTGRRKSSAKAWLEGLDKKKPEKVATADGDFSGKSNNGTSNKKKAKDGDKEMQAPGCGTKPGNEVEKIWLKAPGKFKNYILETETETEIEIKPTQQVFQKRSTYTILPPLTKTDSDFLFKGSSSRTYVIDSEEEKIDSSATLERKKTFAVLSAKNLPAVKTIINAKSHLDGTSQQRPIKKTVSKGTLDLKINDSKVMDKPPTIPKTENRVEKNFEHDKKTAKTNLDFIRKNYLKMKRNRQKRYQNQEDNKKMVIPWDDSVDNSQCSKTSILTIRKSDNATPKVKLRHKNKAFETYAATPIDSQIEPLMVLIHRNLEQPSSYHHRVCDSSVSTETYKVSGASDQLEIMSSPKMGFPEMPVTSSTTFTVSKGMRYVNKAKRNSERCHWEEDIKQYRQIVKDIISQYQRTHDFLKQSQQISKFRRMRDVENDAEMEARDRHFAGQVSNIAEYRKKIMSEYNALPLVDYKSRILKEESGRSSRRGESLATRNLYVAKNMTEDVDSDVKDYQPNVHKILDSQMYVDVRKIGRKVNAGSGKPFEKATSLQTFVRHHRGREKSPEKKNEDQSEGSKSSKKIENSIVPPVDSKHRKIPEKENAPIEWIAIKALNSSSNENGESRPFACFKS